MTIFLYLITVAALFLPAVGGARMQTCITSAHNIDRRKIPREDPPHVLFYNRNNVHKFLLAANQFVLVVLFGQLHEIGRIPVWYSLSIPSP